MRLLFIIDPPYRLNPKKDSTIALMRAAACRGDEVYYAEMHAMQLQNAAVYIAAVQVTMTQQNDSGWLQINKHCMVAADFFDVILMRKEPPVDENFIMATQLLDIASRTVKVVNHPRALREQNEKLAIMNFPDLIAPTWVGADIDELEKFRAQHDKTVLKPLNAMGGQGVYISETKEDRNFRSIAEMLSANGSRLIMAQSYLPAVRSGDFRVFAINGGGLPWMLARIPRSDDHRGNLAAGGTPEVHKTDAATQRIVDIVAPVIAAQGVRFAGLDIIGGRLIEINITCPTGLCEVHQQTNEDVATVVLAAMTD